MEETKEQSEPHKENPLEKEDNRLPYEPPKLRKHGKVSHTTQTIFAIGSFDVFIGPGFLDLS